MKLQIRAVGKLAARAEAGLAQEFLKRAAAMGRQVGLSDIGQREIPESRAPQPASRKSEEAEGLLDNLPSGAVIIALDERGRNLTSRDFSALIARCMQNGTPELVFMVGGPDGLGDRIRQSALHCLAFGAATWPHRLVRVMLAEQIYRAVTILVNHPYHRG